MVKKYMEKKERSVYFSWIFSYVIIVAVCILVSGIAYIQSLQVVEYEINRSNLAMLKQVQITIDGYIRDITNLCNTIAVNPKTNVFMSRERPFKESEWFEISQITKDYIVYKVGNSFIDNFYVYYSKPDLGIAPDGSYDGKLIYELFHQNNEFTYGEWTQMIQQKHMNHFFSITKRTPNGEISKSIACAQTLPLNNPDYPAATIVMLIDEARFQEMIRNIQLDGVEMVMAIDRSNTIMESNQHGQIPFILSYDNLQGLSGTVEEEYKGEKYLVSYVASQVSDWKYISVVPFDVFIHKVSTIQRTIIFCISACLILGGILAFFFAKKNYNPVSELVQAVSSRSGKGTGKKGLNEYTYIKETLALAFDEKDKITQKLAQQNNLLKSNFLARMLKGRIGDKAFIEEALISHNIRFPSECFAVIVFSIEDCSGFLTRGDEEAFDDDVKLIQFIFTNVVEELAGQKHAGYMTEIDEWMVCLVNLEKMSVQNAKQDLTRIAYEAQQFIKEKFRIYTTVAISSVHETWAGIAMAYQEAIEALEYKMIMGSNSVICYEEIIRSADTGWGSYSYSLKTEQKLVNFAKIGDYENAAFVLTEVFDNNISKGTMSVHMIKCLMFDLVSTLIKTTEEFDENSDKCFFEDLNPVEQLVRCETISEMKDLMLYFLNKICLLVNGRKQSHNVCLKEDVVQYIHENYQDINLSVQGIALVFDKNPIYLSKFFKEQTGESMLDYINKFRLEKAKEFLKDKKENIGDVAVKAGYFNINTFARSFKKYEGLTPKQYRDMIQMR